MVRWLTFTATVVTVIAVLVSNVPILFYPNDDTGFSFAELLSNRSHSKEAEKWNFVVTGASSGLGYGTTHHLSLIPNTHTVMACRYMQKCLDAKAKIAPHMHPTSRVSCSVLDLESRDSIEHFAAQITQLFEFEKNEGSSPAPVPIHGLVNNAGLWARKDKHFVHNIESHMAINHLGHVFLTHHLWPHLMSSREFFPARLVTVSSLVSILPLDANYGWFPTSEAAEKRWLPLSNSLEMIALYVRSKRANLMFAAEVQDRFGEQNIASLASHPGYTRTPLVLAVKFLPQWVRNSIHWNPYFSMDELEGAWMQTRAALDQQLGGGTFVGPKFFTAGEAVPVGNLRDEFSTHFWPFTRKESKQLWEQSIEALGIKEFGAVGVAS